MFQKKQKKGFTLVELLIVIAIIGILAGVVFVSTGTSVQKAKRAAALATTSSVLQEIVACQDDGFGLNAYNTSNSICNDASHTEKWPDISTSGWTITAAAQAAPIPDTYNFVVNSPGIYPNIKCKLESSACCDVGSINC